MSNVVTFQDIRADQQLLNNRMIFDDDLFVNDDEADLETEENGKNQKQKDSKRKRNRKKKPSGKNNNKNSNQEKPVTNGNHSSSENSNKENDENEIEIEFVPEEIALDKNFAEFSRIFNYFKLDGSGQIKQEEKVEVSKVAINSKAAELERLKARLFEDEEEEEREKNEKNKEEPKLSKKKLKLQTRLSVAALKQLVNRPDVVEMHDVTAQDPKLLVHLKAQRNTVPVPRHWCAKRKYLQGKRGFEKPAFDLPDFIKRTGIQGMREALNEKEQNKSLKQKMREKVRPKMGKIDIDYQKLHDAFFRWQTKPRMSIHGDLYYEGKELETKLKEKKPGNITDDLRISLGMPTGPNADKVPPPWLIAMQRYGPPPSYPSLKIPGLNAPIPEGCSFGYHAGGWGKPPVDEFGRPLYGDVFGSSMSDLRKPEEEEPVDMTPWGEMEDEVYEEVEPEEESEEEEESHEQPEKVSAEADEEEETEIPEDGLQSTGLKTPGEGLMTPSGISTGLVSAGLETPDMIELRKRKSQIETEMDTPYGEAPALYQILPEKAQSVGGSMMGSSKVYDLSAAKKVDASGVISTTTGIDLALNPDELDMSSDVLQSRYDQQLKQNGDNLDSEDLSDLTADHMKSLSKKRKSKQPAPPASAAQSGSSSEKDKNKKYKEFKF